MLTLIDLCLAVKARITWFTFAPIARGFVIVEVVAEGEVNEGCCVTFSHAGEPHAVVGGAFGSAATVSARYDHLSGGDVAQVLDAFLKALAVAVLPALAVDAWIG